MDYLVLFVMFFFFAYHVHRCSIPSLSVVYGYHSRPIFYDTGYTPIATFYL